MAGSTRALAKGSMGAFHKLLDPLLRVPRAVAGEADELARIAKKMDVDSITRKGRNLAVSKNGWRHTLDSQGRTIRVEQPNLKLNKTTKRSATNQTRAGGKDRLPTDEEFNHFAQNMNLNRGAYKRLENEWERLIEAGNDVRVEITPRFRGGSLRPRKLEVVYWVGNQRYAQTFNNAAGG
ncbi:DNA/RNA non-specific endonuclease [Enemella evansiae]|uniref:DNA/RNA non-specific endonuclease n=1 Tax=Enemella evansiae TaxID=2016499 RepID=UPI000B978594|nr:DNA/RNA non-specific endonuclease [Enemella evansiae]OYN95850.1 hypothetical protein CGZ96_15290 [Enemella evansiae]OYO04059.1 hypothetical protein CGZ97_11820 [Enemella evansiae]